MGNQWGEDEDLMLGEMRRSQTFGEYTVIVSHVDRMMCFDQSSVIVWIDSVRHTHIFDDDDDDDDDDDEDEDEDDDDDDDDDDD